MVMKAQVTRCVMNRICIPVMFSVLCSLLIAIKQIYNIIYGVVWLALSLLILEVFRWTNALLCDRYSQYPCTLLPSFRQFQQTAVWYPDVQDSSPDQFPYKFLGSGVAGIRSTIVIKFFLLPILGSDSLVSPTWSLRFLCHLPQWLPIMPKEICYWPIIAKEHWHENKIFDFCLQLPSWPRNLPAKVYEE